MNILSHTKKRYFILDVLDNIFAHCSSEQWSVKLKLLQSFSILTSAKYYAIFATARVWFLARLLLSCYMQNAANVSSLINYN